MAILDRYVGNGGRVFFEVLARLGRQAAKNLGRERQTIRSQQRGGIDHLSEHVEALLVAGADRAAEHRAKMSFDHVATGPAAPGEKLVSPLPQRAQGHDPCVDSVLGKDQ